MPIIKGKRTVTKVCSRCGEPKPFKFFNKRKRVRLSGSIYYTYRSWCVDCDREDHRVRYHKDAKASAAKVRDWKRSNPESVRKTDRLWVQKNRDKKYRLNNQRHKRVRQATPKWLTKNQWQEIDHIYWLCQDLKSITGENYHVDHIVPLQGKNVCGLHVPWNLQVLPADLNLTKGNKDD